ncbi:MAG: aminoglycoside phosphotransferase family protein [Microthrixaceae bacterium]|nr:aminoglycoside phosphotransferase family protein [Microthrixaceae bacterium]
MTRDVPPAEFDIDGSLVAELIASQHQDLAHLPLTFLASGWDNDIYRLGDELLVRLPRRQFGADLIHMEQRWLPELARGLPLDVPEPLRHGTPQGDYPWPWSICRYFPGNSALDYSFGAGEIDFESAAMSLASFCSAMHKPAPASAPANEYRGVPLSDRSALTMGYLAEVEDLVGVSTLVDIWNNAVSVPPWDGPPLWIHGDLHPGNLIVDRAGEITAVIDFGDLTSGDPATDIAVAWMLFPDNYRSKFRDLLIDQGMLPGTWERARGWALAIGVTVLAHSSRSPVYFDLGVRTLRAVQSDEGDLVGIEDFM